MPRSDTLRIMPYYQAEAFIHALTPEDWHTCGLIRAALRTEVSLVRTVSRPKGLRVILAQIGGGIPKIEHVPAFAQLG
jgi:hypothetical protein